MMRRMYYFSIFFCTILAFCGIKFLRHKKTAKSLFNFLAVLLVPRPGIEPGWIAPLVFETSASTDSAIWALAF